MRPGYRRAFHFFILFLTPLAFLLVLEGGLRLLGLGRPSIETDPARGFLPFQSVFKEVMNEGGELELVVRTPPHELTFMKLRQFNAQSHPAEKPEGEYRILFTGGSLPYGWPYDDRLSFPRLLAVGLAEVRPEVAWRVINMGAPGWGSTRLLALSEELTRLKGDLVVITSGNNEALEASFSEEVFRNRKTRVRVLSWLARRSHLVTFMASHLPRAGGDSEEPGTVERLQALGELAERRDALVDIFESNLSEMVSRYSGSGSRVYLSTVPVNLRSCPPIGRDGPGEVLGPLDPFLVTKYARATAMLGQDLSADAVRLAEELLRELPGSASVHYLHAQALERSGRLAEAARAYRAALDSDSTMLRAFGAINAAAARVAADFGAPLVDFAEAMAEASDLGVPGEDLFLDNSHPNRRGTAVLALTVARAMASDGVLEVSDGWEERFLAAVSAYLDELVIPPDIQFEALKWKFFYFTQVSPDEARARELQREVKALSEELGRAGEDLP